MSDNINITEAAKNQIDKISKQNAGQYVRLAITSGGCNGFSKVWSLDKVAAEDDFQYPCHDSQLLIDKISLEIIGHATIDYRTDLMGSMFIVDIPEASSSCGCGTSFSL
jgi:iron-sulfur cluster insertion protein